MDENTVLKVIYWISGNKEKSEYVLRFWWKNFQDNMSN